MMTTQRFDCIIGKTKDSEKVQQKLLFAGLEKLSKKMSWRGLAGGVSLSMLLIGVLPETAPRLCTLGLCLSPWKQAGGPGSVPRKG